MKTADLLNIQWNNEERKQKQKMNELNETTTKKKHINKI